LIRQQKRTSEEYQNIVSGEGHENIKHSKKFCGCKDIWVCRF